MPTIPIFGTRAQTALRTLETLGQLHGEGHAHHPTESHPLAPAYAMAYRFGWQPADVLDMPAELFMGMSAYTAGRDRGEAISRRRASG